MTHRTHHAEPALVPAKRSYRLQVDVPLLHDILRRARRADETADLVHDSVVPCLVAAPDTAGLRVELRRPAQTIGDLLTVAEYLSVPLQTVALCRVGEAGNDSTRDLLLAGALLGMDVRIAAPRSMWPAEDLIVEAEDLAARTGARLLVTSDAGHAVLGADVVVAGEWGYGTVLPVDGVAPAAFVVDERFVAGSGVAHTAVLTTRLGGRAAATAVRSLAGAQERNRRLVDEVLWTIRRRAGSGSIGRASWLPTPESSSPTISGASARPPRSDAKNRWPTNQ